MQTPKFHLLHPLSVLRHRPGFRIVILLCRTARISSLLLHWYSRAGDRGVYGVEVRRGVEGTTKLIDVSTRELIMGQAYCRMVPYKLIPYVF